MGRETCDGRETMKVGICMQGLEEVFERTIMERAKADEPFVFLEIGTAHCDTLQSVCRLLATTKSQWRVIAIDPWVYSFEAYQQKIAPEFSPDKALLLVQTREEAFKTEKERIGDRLDFVFIDGCHSKRCVIGDFLSVEPLVVPGGLVVFHDINQPPGGIQEHCNAQPDVQGALEELGLWNDTLSGWKRLPDWISDASKNGFNCGVFERV